jgi:hypothetical protein
VLRGGEALHPLDTATTITVADGLGGGVMVTDGRVYVKNVGVTDQGWSEPSSEVRCNTQIVTDYARRAISTW